MRSLAAVLFFCFALATSVTAQDSTRVGDFSLTTTEGTELQLSSLRGQVVLLNFWATWCAPCLKEMPDLNTLYQELSPLGFTVVGLAIDGEDKETIDRFVERLEVSYPVVYGAVADAQSVLNSNAVPIMPTTLVIDREGYLDRRIVGVVPLKETKSYLLELLSQ